MAAAKTSALCALLLLVACPSPPPAAPPAAAAPGPTASVEVVSSDPAAKIFAGDVELGTGSVRLRVVGAAPGASLHVEATNPAGDVSVRAGAPPPAAGAAAVAPEAPEGPALPTVTAPGAEVEGEAARSGQEPQDGGTSAPASGDGEPRDDGQAAKGPGWLALIVKPWADVFINGQRVGTTPLPRRQLAPGIYRVRLVNKELGADVSRTVTIRAGETTKLRQELSGR